MWKKDESGNLVVDANGDPIWVADDKEIPVNYSKLESDLRSVTSESIGRKETIRERDEEIAKLKKAQANTPDVSEELKKQLEEKDQELLAIKKQHNDSLLSNAFSASSFIKDNVAIHPEMIRAQFGKHFDVEDGRIVAKDQDGNTIYSSTDYGKPASFEEAISKIIDQCSYKDTFLKSSGNKGGGAGNGGGKAHGKWSDYSESERVSLSKSDPQAFAALLKTRDEKEK